MPAGPVCCKARAAPLRCMPGSRPVARQGASGFRVAGRSAVHFFRCFWLLALAVPAQPAMNFEVRWKSLFNTGAAFVALRGIQG